MCRKLPVPLHETLDTWLFLSCVFSCVCLSISIVLSKKAANNGSSHTHTCRAFKINIAAQTELLPLVFFFPFPQLLINLSWKKWFTEHVLTQTLFPFHLPCAFSHTLQTLTPPTRSNTYVSSPVLYLGYEMALRVTAAWANNRGVARHTLGLWPHSWCSLCTLL